MAHRSLLPLAAAATCMALASAGCAAVPTATLDRASVEGRISSWLAGHYHLARPAVACPPGVSGDAGTRFVCSATVAGTPLTVTGTVAGQGGEFRIALDRAVIDRDLASRTLAARLAIPGAPGPAVDCGPGPVVIAPGSSFTCTATYGHAAEDVLATASDVEGDVTFSVGPAAHAAPAGGSHSD